MENESIKEEILSALASGEYEAEFEPNDSVVERTGLDGGKFYVFLEDTVKCGINVGSFTVHVAGHTFVYDLNCGDWSADDSDLIEDHEIIDALEGLDEFIDYEKYDMDKQWKVFAKSEGIDLDTDYYCSEDAPESIEDLETDVEVPVRYGICMSHGACSEFQDGECTIMLKDLMALQEMVGDEDDEEYDEEDEELDEDEEEDNEDDNEDEDEYNEDEIEVADVDIKAYDEELYNRILKAVEVLAEDDGYDNEEGYLSFVLILSWDLFDEYLSEPEIF